jgi:hypothetical protein
MPGAEMAINSEKQTKPGFISKPLLDMGDLRYKTDVSHYDGMRQIWVKGRPELTTEQIIAYATALLRAANPMPHGAEVFSIARGPRHTYLALSCKRDVYAFGGIFARRSAMRDQIAQTFRELDAVLKVASAMIAAEALLQPKAPE